MKYLLLCFSLLLPSVASADYSEKTFLFQVAPDGFELFIGVMADGQMCKAVAAMLQLHTTEYKFVCKPRPVRT